MKIKKFGIYRFRSISKIIIPLTSYGIGKKKSSVIFLVGLNESGKSSILDAINFSQEGFKNIEFEDYFHKDEEEETDLRIETEIEIEQPFLNDLIIKNLGVEAEFVKRLNISSLYKVTYLNDKNYGSVYWFDTNVNFPFHTYITVGAEKKIENLAIVNNIKEVITQNSAKDFLKEGQSLLTRSSLQNLLASKLKTQLDPEMPNIQLWKSKPEFLINTEIDLNDFKNDTSISIPLRNIFHVHGYNDDDKIKKAIEKALKKTENKAELQANLSKSITTYINKIWKEHKINIKVNIDGPNCSVHVEDKDREHKYFNMKQRSDGFNQFVSLILSLSSPNDTKILSDSIILLDEPETHLHPSGIKYMRDEILKIGKNNHVIV